MLNDNTITLCSLAEPDLTRYTIENAIGWTTHMEYDQIIKCKDDGKPVLDIKQKQEEFIRRIKESGLHFRIKRIFHVIHPNLTWKHECKFIDNAMRYLKLFVKNDIPFTLLPSEGMTEDLERLQQNSPPLYDKIIRHLEAKENSSAGAQEYIDAEKLLSEIKGLQCEQGFEDGMEERGYQFAIKDILDIIASFQQEPRFPQYDKIVDKVFGAGNLEGFEYREAEMLVALAKEELLKSLQQERPDVDLEKLGEIARHLIAVKNHEEDMRLDEGEWLLLERIGYPERFNAGKG